MCMLLLSYITNINICNFILKLDTRRHWSSGFVQNIAQYTSLLSFLRSFCIQIFTMSPQTYQVDLFTVFVKLLNLFTQICIYWTFHSHFLQDKLVEQHILQVVAQSAEILNLSFSIRWHFHHVPLNFSLQFFTRMCKLVLL